MHAIFYLKCYDDVIFEVRNWFLDSGLVSLNLNLRGQGGEGWGEGGAGSHLCHLLFFWFRRKSSQRHQFQLNLEGLAPSSTPVCLYVLGLQQTLTDDPVGFLEPSFGDK